MNSSLYFHIPYCKQACTYCDFHFSTNAKTKSAVLEAMFAELLQRSVRYPWNSAEVKSIYFGGGTPSLLNKEELRDLLQGARRYFKFAEGPIEITLEANPDDITPKRLQDWHQIGFNRLSVGIQSFHSGELALSNRAHTAEESLQVLEWINESPFENYSVDLIYGMPGSNVQSWYENLVTVLKYNPPHISCYNLTVEDNTALAHQIERGDIELPSEEEVLSQYAYLRKWASKNGYEHYELSNFSKSGYRSVHNQHYWSYEPYLGIGPGAHSFDGKKRFWNVSNNNLYLKGATVTEERLSMSEQINERIMVRLRTAQGFRFDKDLPKEHLSSEIRSQLLNSTEAGFKKGVIYPMPDGFRILPENWMTSDDIIAGLMIEHDDD